MWEDDPSHPHEQPYDEDILPFDQSAAGNEFKYPGDVRVRPPTSRTLLSRIPASVVLTVTGVFAATALATVASFAVGPNLSATTQPQNQGDVGPLTTLTPTTTWSRSVHSPSAESSQRGTSTTHGSGKSSRATSGRPGENITTTDETPSAVPSHPSQPPTTRTPPTCQFAVFCTPTDSPPPPPTTSAASSSNPPPPVSTPRT